MSSEEGMQTRRLRYSFSWLMGFHYITEQRCNPNPRVESDPLNYDTARFHASRALTNSDKTTSNSNWLGKDRTAPTYFTYDLGCILSVSKLVLRNGCNGSYKDRYDHLLHILGKVTVLFIQRNQGVHCLFESRPKWAMEGSQKRNIYWPPWGTVTDIGNIHFHTYCGTICEIQLYKLLWKRLCFAIHRSNESDRYSK